MILLIKKEDLRLVCNYSICCYPDCPFSGGAWQLQVGSVSRAQIDVLRCWTVSSKILPLISSKSDIVTFWGCGLIPLSTTQEYADHLSAIIDFLREGSKLTAFAVWELFTGNLAWGGFVRLSTVAKKSVCVIYVSAYNRIHTSILIFHIPFALSRYLFSPTVSWHYFFCCLFCLKSQAMSSQAVIHKNASLGEFSRKVRYVLS